MRKEWIDFAEKVSLVLTQEVGKIKAEFMTQLRKNKPESKKEQSRPLAGKTVTSNQRKTGKTVLNTSVKNSIKNMR